MYEAAVLTVVCTGAKGNEAILNAGRVLFD